MWLYLDLNHKVTCRSYWRKVALLADPKVYPIINSFGDCDGLLHCVEDRALSAASHARVTNHLARPVTVSAHLLDGEGTLANGLEAGTSTSTAA